MLKGKRGLGLRGKAIQINWDPWKGPRPSYFKRVGGLKPFLKDCRNHCPMLKVSIVLLRLVLPRLHKPYQSWFFLCFHNRRRVESSAGGLLSPIIFAVLWLVPCYATVIHTYFSHHASLHSKLQDVTRTYIVLFLSLGHYATGVNQAQ